ncbi:MAG: type II toxin-antitoxin system Phd/YefM family antitoxin [Clostridiales bacterium]|nr:type II toxin-antitoxin system Phd/YefM family antitoxin [Clostridiales bacterium]
MDLRNALDNIISVSELGRGKASKVIQNVESNKEQYIVVKNNKPQAIIMSIEEYSDLQKLREEYELLKLAAQRVSESNDAEYRSIDDVMKDLDIDEKDLEDLEDDVDIE